MTDSYHFESEPEPRATELGCGEFVITADGGVRRCAHWGRVYTTSASEVRKLGWSDVEKLARHLEGQQYKRVGHVGPFPSGATLTTSGDKIVGRVESMTPTLDKLEASKDPQRSPLPHFNQRTPHDTFGPDFIVTKGAVEAPTTPSPTTDSAYPAIAGLLRG